MLDLSTLKARPCARLTLCVLAVLERVAPSAQLIDVGASARAGAAAAGYPETNEYAFADPLVYKEKMRAGLIAGSLRLVDQMESCRDGVAAPILIVHSRRDTLTDWQGSARFAAACPSCELVLIDVLWHALLHEKPHNARVWRTLTNWLQRRAAEAGCRVPLALQEGEFRA